MAGEEVEGGGDIFAVGEEDIAPGGIGAAGEAEGVAEAGAGEGEGQAVFVDAVVEEGGQGDGGELGEVGGEGDGIIVLLGAEPEGADAETFEEVEESHHARGLLGGEAGFVGDERPRGVVEEAGGGGGDAGDFAAGHGMAG